MANKRDSWDKSKRQRKVWLQKEMPNGPSPVGEFLRKVRAKYERLRKEKEEQRQREIEFLAQKEWRQFTIPPAVKEWLIAKKWLREGALDEARLIQAVQSTLANRPISKKATPVKFWMYCRSVRAAIEKAERLGHPLNFKPPSSKILYWLMKFRPEKNPK